ncbi:PIN domain-containing protein [Leptolyngbya sp. PCC 6406]|uniref:PIN domain-containing protein n=1 Tax=Leptolyngbya sp. PCC 6406 TaxID=1173264 RepID=UPI0002ABF889|nr:PIN domain-containing protein [Leptolyngbya sp. PCC 6406]
MSDKKQEPPDIFVSSKIYPDAKGIFYEGYKALEEIREECTVVLDTNALLVPYGISKNSLSQIAATYKYLVNSNRLVVPGQVAREFAKNRPVKIAEIFRALSRKRSIASPNKGRYPLLEDAKGYPEVQELEEKIGTLIKEYQAAIGDLLSHIKSWNWNDPVSQLYSEIFPAAILDLDLDEEVIVSRLKYQKENKLPPGYKDAAKDDQGIGDHLVWQVVVHVAKERKQPVVLVSDDSKADWFYRVENQPLFPRFELVDEIRRVSDGKSLHIISFSSFLELFGVTDKAIGEVRREEIKANYAYPDSYKRKVRKHHIEKVVGDWLRSQASYCEVNREGKFGDFVWSEWGGASTLISIEYFDDVVDDVKIVAYLKSSIDQFEINYERKDFEFDNILIFLVFDSEISASLAAKSLASWLTGISRQGIEVVVAELLEGESINVHDPLKFLSSLDDPGAV